MARPSKYNEKLANKLCAELAIGNSLRTVCKQKDMPSVQTVFNWFKTHPEFLEQYTRAKEESADALTDEMLHIADGDMKDNVDVNHARLKIDTRKWLASKLKPKKYGEKVEKPKDDTKPVTIKITGLDTDSNKAD